MEMIEVQPRWRVVRADVVIEGEPGILWEVWDARNEIGTGIAWFRAEPAAHGYAATLNELEALAGRR